MDEPKEIRLLLVSRQGVSRSRMAAGFILHRCGHGVQVWCAGSDAEPVHPVAVQVMAEEGIDISGIEKHALESIRDLEFDVVITFCPRDEADCPMLTGKPEVVNWDLPEPPPLPESPEEILATFRRLREELRELVVHLLDRGYLTALAMAKRQSDLILNNLTEGIIAHDLDRRIVCFNDAAEAITEFDREEVLGRDCYDVFPGGFCGGKCSFVGEQQHHPVVPTARELNIATRSGEARNVESLIKPMLDYMGRAVGVLVSFHDVTRERRLERRLGEIEQFSGIIGRDPKMLEIFDLIRDVAGSDVSVLVQGESGTGKELVAAAIHNESNRANRLFVPVNCGALPEGLLESELFGHVRGAFTGAIRDKKGRFELADGGTIFLDEIGDVSPAMQVKLLRVLQEGTFERLGSEKTVKVDVRVISATNRDIVRETREGRFREDLFYRLSVVPIHLPPLRERPMDIPLLADSCLRRIASDRGRGTVRFSSEAMSCLMSQPWPGNVRELQNWIQFALVKCKGAEIGVEHLPVARFQPHAASSAASRPPGRRRRKRKIDPESLREALAKTGGNKVHAAELLGVSRATLYRFLDENPELAE
ncbi:sigma 54-interacting transcriptional regulator [Candidatus Sumerlaeota bacterium]|nr:sigma 54-interacting transcriptional regulator [Candidatus Sumerlaeota bacterium]